MRPGVWLCLIPVVALAQSPAQQTPPAASSQQSTSHTAPPTEAQSLPQSLPPPLATIEMEWEVVEGATGYEVKLMPRSGGEALFFKTSENRISQRVPVGAYEVQIRSRDKATGYYGKWGEAMDLEVNPKAVQLSSPADGTALANSGNDESTEVVFQWEPMRDARQYTLKVWSDSVEQAETFATQETTFRIKLATARVYHWSVTFETTNSVRYEADPRIFSFSLHGKRLLRPEVEPGIVSKDEPRVKWSESPNAQFYQAKILRRSLDETEWQPWDEKPRTEKQTWKAKKLIPGAYRIEVTAHADLRMSSEPGFFEFTVKPTETELLTALKPALALGESQRRTGADKQK